MNIIFCILFLYLYIFEKFETVKSWASLRIAQDKVNPKNYYAYNPEFDGA